MEICAVCSKEISSEEVKHSYRGVIMHYKCLPKFQENPENYDVPATSREQRKKAENKRAESKDYSRGSVITDIDLPWGRVFWVFWQFTVVGVVLAIPLWIVLSVLF
jgi:hypothetical protein